MKKTIFAILSLSTLFFSSCNKAENVVDKIEDIKDRKENQSSAAELEKEIKEIQKLLQKEVTEEGVASAIAIGALF